MILAGITVLDTTLVRDAVELSRSLLEPYLFNHVMRSWLFGILLSDGVKPAPDPELLAVSTVLHDLGLTDRHAASNAQSWLNFLGWLSRASSNRVFATLFVGSPRRALTIFFGTSEPDTLTGSRPPTLRTSLQARHFTNSGTPLVQRPKEKAER